MHILLTGSTGLLGSHILEQALIRKNHVTVFVRDIPRRSYLYEARNQYPNQLSVIQGGALNDFKSDIVFDAVIHSAAMTSVDSSKKEEVWSTNFQMTKDLYLSLHGKFKKWVQISSISTLCDGSMEMVDESHQGHFRKTNYAESKFAADQWLEEQSKNILYIHPCYMLGKWDVKPSSGAIFHAIKFNKIDSFVNAVKNFVSPRDVAIGIFQALEAKAVGHYILGNENLELKKFFDLACRELNMPNTLQQLNDFEKTEDWIKEFCFASAVSWEKAKKEFSYCPQTSLAEMMKETVDFFESVKMLRRAKKQEI